MFFLISQSNALIINESCFPSLSFSHLVSQCPHSDRAFKNSRSSSWLRHASWLITVFEVLLWAGCDRCGRRALKRVREQESGSTLKGVCSTFIKLSRMPPTVCCRLPQSTRWFIVWPLYKESKSFRFWTISTSLSTVGRLILLSEIILLLCMNSKEYLTPKMPNFLKIIFQAMAWS